MKNFRQITYLFNTFLVAICLYPHIPNPIQTQLRLDYIFHFFSYLIVTVLALKGFSQKKIVLIFFFIQGITIEILQIFTGRSFELNDIFFNSVGIISAFLIFRFFPAR